jgi:uncharacterized protein (TIGR02679 family)
MNENLERQCIEYFKRNKGYKRLFEGIREKYRSLGSLSGTVVLNNLSQFEQEALSGLLRKDYYSKKSASIKVEKVIKVLEDTRFSEVNFENVLKGYFGEELVSKKEERNLYELEREEYFNDFLVKFKGTRGEEWLRSFLQSKGNAYKMLSQKYDKEKDNLSLTLLFVMKALNALSFNEKNLTRLALFSSNISKNPHTFDQDRDCGKLLLYGISYFLNIDYPSTAEERTEALYKAGVINDEVSNYTTISGLLAYKENKVHEGWMGFYETSEPLQVSLWNLSEIDYIVSPSKKVFVFENPTVFSEVLYSTRNKKPPLICTYGQIKIASLILLDKLLDRVDAIYYSGDFDPEGLLIADRLKKRYKDKLILWRYDADDYFSIKSDKSIEASRIKKLDKLKCQELKELGEYIRREGNPAYQELLVEKYIEDIYDII